MHVTTEIKARVVAKLVEGIALIKAHYGVSLNMPAVKYAKRGTTAGTAEIRNWTVNFTTAMPAATYCAVAISNRSSGTGNETGLLIPAQGTTNVQIHNFGYDGVYRDPTWISVAVFA